MRDQPIRKSKLKKPWPTKAAMQQVYALNLWGTTGLQFYSGEGSHLDHIVEPYIRAVRFFLNSLDEQLVMCDLGCGDFNVGKQLLSLSRKYIAVDIVPELIAHNQTVYKAAHLEFLCLDIAKDELPQADCVIIRQVLQHLSNAEILATLNKLTAYKYVILTEHIPNGDFIPNLDIISGQGTRLKKGSGVDVLNAPFNFKIIEEWELVVVELGGNRGLIRTVLYEL